jgi:hypothetical protein
VPVKQYLLDVVPDRNKPSIFFYDNGLRCSFALQKQKAPLVFLIAGTGSSGQSPKLIAMMEQLYQAGFHVITMPSSTHPNFIISASLDSVPGVLTEDARDIYRAMESAWNRVKGDIEVSDFLLGGYSLGGTQAAFVAKLDEDRKVFNFSKVLMIDPAVSLHTSVSRIEAMLDKIPGGPKKIGTFFSRMLAMFTEFYSEGNYIAINDEFLYSVYKADLLTQDEAGGLIALAFRINSAGMIFSSDVMTNGGYVVPKNRILVYSEPFDPYFQVCVRLSFLDYFNEYLFPHFQKKQPAITKASLIESESLKSIEAYLKSSPKFGVMANENDFIMGPGDLDYLRTLFGERTKVYPRGGHLGNLEYRDNMAHMIGFFSSFNKSGGAAQ